ncbi:MAG TPA: outer membrane protein assembly factor BamE [Caulobacteraceae bacterium]|nr:outer membrane protein assembly factor BamE [Caulobacteraceae bacterium]
MFRAAPLLAGLAASAALVSACTPTTSFQGFQAIDARPQDVQVGVDTRESVKAKLGTPSVVSTFDPDVWYYVSQVTENQSFYRQRLIRRDVVAISFNKGGETVAKVDDLTLKDGRVIAFDGHVTPTRGRELTVIEQLIGSIGNGQFNNNTQQNPGSRPGQP